MYMKIRSKIRTEKLDISLSDYAIVLRRCCNYVHDFASLNILRSLNALRAEIALAPFAS